MSDTHTDRYSTETEKQDFIKRLIEGNSDDIRDNGATPERRPMLVLDMDGNFAIGYDPVAGVTFKLEGGDDPEEQAIPLSFSSTKLQELAEAGQVTPKIFATKALDIRITPEIVALMNENIADTDPNRKFDIVILTSRGAGGLEKILRASGVNNPEMLTMVADSGANISVGGQKMSIPLTGAESSFLQNIKDQRPALEAAVNEILIAKGYNPEGRPALYMQEKGVARNVEWGEILEHYKSTAPARELAEEEKT